MQSPTPADLLQDVLTEMAETAARLLELQAEAEQLRQNIVK